MASYHDIDDTRDSDESSDEECLATLKRKATYSPDPDEKKSRQQIDGDVERFLSNVEVKIEYCSDGDRFDTDFDSFSNSIFGLDSTGQSTSQESPKKKRRRLFPCECGTVFTSLQDLKKHTIENHMESTDASGPNMTTPIYKCTKCAKCFMSEDELSIHLQYHTEGNFPICNICHRRFQFKSDLYKHMLTHEQSLYKCMRCPQHYPDKALLDDHYRKSHTTTKECPICKLPFKTMEVKIAHMDSEHNVPGLSSCYHCGEQFPSSSDRDEHVEYAHALDGDCFKCGHTPCKCNDQDMLNETDLDIKEDEFPMNETIEANDDNDPLEASSEQMYVQCMYNVPLKREDLSHPTQCAIVAKMHKGKSVADVCRLYNLTPEIVNEIWEERDNYIVPKKIGMKSSKYINSVLDAKILEWFYRQREIGAPVSGKMLINVAEEFAKECGFVVFNGNIKWLDRFKTRHKISLRPTQVKREKPRGPNDAKWKEQFLNEIWPDVSKRYHYEDIYTADEVGLFYNSSRGRIKKHSGRKFIHGFEKDRVSIFMCCNMSGKKKRKLLVCGTEDPLPYSHRKPETLPVTYIRHSQAQFTTAMFEEYVKAWNSQLKAEDKKAVLILDRASIHTKLSMTHLKLVFVPWKASVGLMPIKHGIFNRFRDEFRKLILQEKAMNVLRGIDRNFTCLEGLEMIDKAWNRVPMNTIIGSFELIGYKVPPKHDVDIVTPKISNRDDERIAKMLEDYDIQQYYADLVNMDMFLTVDEDLLTAQGTNGSVFGGNHKVPEPIGFEDAERGEILPIAENRTDLVEREKLILKARALEDLEIVRKYLETNKTNHDTFKVFMDVEKFLLRNPHKSQK